MKLKVVDYPGLVRDSKSKAISNIDSDAYKEYQNKKLLQNKVINITDEINELKQSMDEIKGLLSQILQRKD
jgi:hypothetical protein